MKKKKYNTVLNEQRQRLIQLKISGLSLRKVKK